MTAGKLGPIGSAGRDFRHCQLLLAVAPLHDIHDPLPRRGIRHRESRHPHANRVHPASIPRTVRTLATHAVSSGRASGSLTSQVEQAGDRSTRYESWGFLALVPAVGVLVRGEVPERGVRSVHVVVDAPVFEFDACLEEVVE
jgi:hypothetical protein